MSFTFGFDCYGVRSMSRFRWLLRYFRTIFRKRSVHCIGLTLPPIRQINFPAFWKFNLIPLTWIMKQIAPIIILEMDSIFIFKRLFIQLGTWIVILFFITKRGKLHNYSEALKHTAHPKENLSLSTFTWTERNKIASRHFWAKSNFVQIVTKTSYLKKI